MRSVLDGVSDLRRIARWSSMSFGPKPRPPNSASRSYGAAQKYGLSPRVARPTELTTTSAPTRKPLKVTALAEPRPPFRLKVVAPNPAPAVPSAKSTAAFDAALRPKSQYGGLRPQDLSPPLRRSNRLAPGTIGTRTPRCSKPRPVSAR